jgi:succinyl-CoA synthetase alpha subunit
MSILLDAKARVAIVGITGNFGKLAARDLPAAGTNVVAGVSAGRGGIEVEGVPVYSTAEDAVTYAGADTALVYVPAPLALDAVLEALDAGCTLIAYPGDGLPVADAIQMRAAAQRAGARIVGPNSPGLISPGKAKLGFMPTGVYAPGPIGLMSRSGSLSYECAYRLTAAGLGQTTALGLGGDPVKGTKASEALALFHDDPETEALVYLGEIGGGEEAAVAEYASRSGAKPVAALLVGRTAPPGRQMGHAAALIGSHADTWAAKVESLEAAGVTVARSLTELVTAARSALET